MNQQLELITLDPATANALNAAVSDVPLTHECPRCLNEMYYAGSTNKSEIYHCTGCDRDEHVDQ